MDAGAAAIFLPNNLAEDVGALSNNFFLSVDVIHCPISEPNPSHRNWFSHLIRGPAFKCEIGVSMEGNIAWVSSPCRGSVHCVHMFRAALHLAIPDGCQAIVPCPVFAYGRDEKVAPLRDDDDEGVLALKKRAVARHEACNQRIKDFKVTSHCFRHDLSFHSVCFTAVSVLCQHNIENGEPLLDIVAQFERGLVFVGHCRCSCHRKIKK